jgi:hypothetical protein
MWKVGLGDGDISAGQLRASMLTQEFLLYYLGRPDLLRSLYLFLTPRRDSITRPNERTVSPRTRAFLRSHVLLQGVKLGFKPAYSYDKDGLFTEKILSGVLLV